MDHIRIFEGVINVFFSYILSEDVVGMNTTFIEIHNSVVNNMELSLTKLERNVKRKFSSTNSKFVISAHQ